MIGTTLLEISDHIESLASETGEYSLVCARYGDRPVPAAGLRFESRAVARAAARATEQYRDALRRYDPRLPYYDVIVRQEFVGDEPGATPSALTSGRRGGPAAETDAGSRNSDGSPDPDDPRDPDDPHDVRRFSATEAAEWSLSDPVVEGGGDDRRRDRVEFCHEAAAAVFEALSAGGHDDAESAVMDAYFELAERVSDPDDLCLCLLEAMAEALHRRLTPDEQASVLSAAAAGLPPVSGGDPVSGAFDRLSGAGVVDGYVRESDSASGSAAERATVLVSDCALTPRDGRFPTLPLVLELYRRTEPSRRHDAVRIASAEEGWRISLAAGSGDGPVGLASAAIRS
ncbi:DUF7551 domain-containing protein [Halorubrum amylolyticum]|uniref:DUF7551 domain-containing protein n=1 Tax=Halorubrum amylolyticum TaxID=2508724 RepID=UPI00100905EA|nr:hypothetical protein [Halorubrum amylolyticum]